MRAISSRTGRGPADDAGGGLVQDEQVGSWISAQHRPTSASCRPTACPGRAKQMSPVARSGRQCGGGARRRRGQQAAKELQVSSTDSVGYRFLPRPCGMWAMRGTPHRGGGHRPCRRPAPHLPLLHGAGPGHQRHQAGFAHPVRARSGRPCRPAGNVRSCRPPIGAMVAG